MPRYLGHHFNGGQALSLVLMIAGVACARVRYKMLVKHGQPWDWYPEDGVGGELPPECNAYLDAQVARAAAEAARPVEKKKAKPKAKGKR